MGQCKMSGKIYCISNIENGKQYIGQTHRSLETRFQEHCGTSTTSVSPKLKNAIKKYGKNKFKIDVLWAGDVSDDELNNMEIKYIETYNTLHPNGYNLTKGGAGGRHSDETKLFLSEKSKKMWENKRDAMLEIRRQQWTDERKAKLSETLKQRYIDHPEMRIKKRSALPAIVAPEAGDVGGLKIESDNE